MEGAAVERKRSSQNSNLEKIRIVSKNQPTERLFSKKKVKTLLEEKILENLKREEEAQKLENQLSAHSE
jgi:hypothetical protein